AAERERQQALRVEPGALDPALGEVPGRPAQEVEHGPGLLLSCRESADFARFARCARLLRRRWPILQAVGSADFARLRLAARDRRVLGRRQSVGFAPVPLAARGRFALPLGVLPTPSFPPRPPGGGGRGDLHADASAGAARPSASARCTASSSSSSSPARIPSSLCSVTPAR